ncbi:MAG: glycerol kinase [Planctomycetota bacterium]|nr:MAG: glycerol kinase [Planctomycetota bacterium]
MSKSIVALDQGTTSSRTIVFDARGTIVCSAQREFPQLFPQPGHVEHDPEAIWNSQLATLRQAVQQSPGGWSSVAALGITNQRETTLVWERDSGRPVCNAIVWQSRITADRCTRLREEGAEPLIRERTGLVLDPYFSATKIAHILDTVPGARIRAERGELLFGTVDSFLVWRLTGGRRHVTDPSNASRTLLWNIHRCEWDPDLLQLFDVPRAMLPEVQPSSGVIGETDPTVVGAAVPIAGMAGDQQAALFGQTCFEEGDAKNTYGTGCFVLMNTGPQPVLSKHGLLTTVAWQIGRNTVYALEGAVFVAGAAVQWLRDGLGLIETAEEIERLAATVDDNGGTYFVPAFVGLGAPHWDATARGMLIGLTRGTTRGHVARATLEAIAFQTRDVLDAMTIDGGIRLSTLKVDGGASRNDLLMQIQADVLDTVVRRPAIHETTALGAAYLAGLGVGLWDSLDDLRKLWQLQREFTPTPDSPLRTAAFTRWRAAVERAKGWTTAASSAAAN